MKKEWLLAAVASLLTLGCALGLLRLFAPRLLGIPVDLQMVRVAEEVAPFYDAVFREEDRKADTYMLKDPYIKRAKPFYPNTGTMGPHDLLGFRNAAIPNAADIVTIGDSQTYGNNALLEENWPSALLASLGDRATTLYNISVGGWGPVEYLEIFDKALHFSPRVIVIAFYTGNDPLEAFRQVYGNERWAYLIPDSSLTAGDHPRVNFPVPPEEYWPVRFGTGMEMFFTPAYRHASNSDHPAVRAGYAVMAEVAGRIAGKAAAAGVPLVMTIIPTKEYVYAERIRREGIRPAPAYSALIADEGKKIAWLGGKLAALAGVTFVDIAAAMQEKALSPVPLYPTNPDGHPIMTGYAVIAGQLRRAVATLLPEKIEGPVMLRYDDGYSELCLLQGRDLWAFASEEIYRKNGWSTEVRQLPVTDLRSVAHHRRRGLIEAVLPMFGPPR
ncbi:MAG: SGNH/GDSL hydrolase family protein [Thermodesulfobacteriota bacterium]